MYFKNISMHLKYCYERRMQMQNRGHKLSRRVYKKYKISKIKSQNSP